MIQANCRNHFTLEDFEYIREVLSTDEENAVALTSLLADEEMRDDILDHHVLAESMRSHRGFTRISPYLYFYVLIREVFREYDITRRDLADYVATLLAEFSASSRAHQIDTSHPKQYQYLVDMMIDFSESNSSYEAFLLRSHLGNYALFISGVYPDYVNHRALYRRAPGFDYYEKMGSSSYRWASSNKFAVKYQLTGILQDLSEQFRLVRIALNDLVDKYISLDERPEDMDRTLRRIFFDDPSRNV